MLSTIASRLAYEISQQDWSDAHSRADGARHNRESDRTTSDQLDPDDAETIRLNVVWVVGQALFEDDPSFNIREFAEAAGVPRRLLLTRRGTPSGFIEAGLRRGEGQEVLLRREGPFWTATLRNAPLDGRRAVATSTSAATAISDLLDDDKRG